jgi:hypothetical protein
MNALFSFAGLFDKLSKSASNEDNEPQPSVSGEKTSVEA